MAGAVVTVPAQARKVCLLLCHSCVPPLASASALLSSFWGHLLLLLLGSPPSVSATEALLASHLQFFHCIVAPSSPVSLMGLLLAPLPFPASSSSRPTGTAPLISREWDCGRRPARGRKLWLQPNPGTLPKCQLLHQVRLLGHSGWLPSLVCCPSSLAHTCPFTHPLLFIYLSIHSFIYAALCGMGDL